jgi:subtilase family serine protease
MNTKRTRLNVEPLEKRELLSYGPYTPLQIRHAYGFDQLGGLDGSGQTIAIVDAGGDPSIRGDLAMFDQSFSIPPPPNFWIANQDGGTKILPKPLEGGTSETALDVEWAHAIAPGANILLVETNSEQYQDQFKGVNLGRNQTGVVAVSMSWGVFDPSGYGENSGEASLDYLFTSPSGHIGGSGLPGGVTFVAASGDQGAPYVGYPGFSPNVLAVGGTSLFLDDQGNWLNETGWSGSGGGYSQVEPEPAYQYGIQYTGARGAPDVSYDGDANTGFVVFDSGSGGWIGSGGTSAGAPQWAALIALCDQFRASQYGRGALDGASQTLPQIYNIGGDFIDITTGSNGGYACRPGWDEVTGMGSPYAPYVVPDLAAAGINRPGGAASPAEPSRPHLADDKVIAASALIQLSNDQGLKLAMDRVFAESSNSQSRAPLVADMSPVLHGRLPTGKIAEAQPTFLKSSGLQKSNPPHLAGSPGLALADDMPGRKS